MTRCVVIRLELDKVCGDKVCGDKVCGDKVRAESTVPDSSRLG